MKVLTYAPCKEFSNLGIYREAIKMLYSGVILKII